MSDWKQSGIRIVRAGELDTNTPQTPGMSRAAAITHARTGANKLWAGTVTVQPAARTGAHHHGELETVLYIIRGRARFRWGDHLEFVEEAGPGDFIYVPPFVPHQEMNARPDEPVEAVVVRSGQEPIVVNLDIESPEPAEPNAGPGPVSTPSRIEVRQALNVQPGFQPASTPIRESVHWMKIRILESSEFWLVKAQMRFCRRDWNPRSHDEARMSAWAL